MRPMLAAVSLALLAACAGAPPSQGAPDPEHLFRTKCAGCHRLYPPESRTRAQWSAVLRQMSRKAPLSPAVAAALGGVLAAHAADAPAGGGAP